MSKLEDVVKDLIDLPDRKVRQLLCYPGYLRGCFFTITHYGFKADESSWKVFVEAISDKLSGSGVEYEFSETEYKNLLALKDLPGFNK